MPVTQPGVWGIDLGQCALKAIRLEMVDGEVTATAFDYIEHPKILSQPDADPDALTREALDKFLSRNTLRGDTVVISVPGQSGLARFVKLPPVEEKKIADIVRFEAKQQIPFPLDEVVWDFQKLSAGVVTDGFALETEIGLFAMKRDMVNRALQHFQDVNVEVHIVQMAPLALCNFVSHDLLGKAVEGAQPAAAEEEEESEDEEAAGKKSCVVALDIGTDNSNLVITDGEKIIWQRPIPIGGNHFTRALTKDLKLTFAKAEHLKRNAVKSPDLKKILAALRPVLNDFVGEVQRSLGYFTNTHRDAHVKYMMGLGNAFRLPGLQKFLSEKLQLEVRKLSGFKRLTGESVTSAPQFTENILSFAVAHGLGLQGLKLTRLHTNLLPQEIRTERLVRAKKPWAAAAAALLLVGVAGLAFGQARQRAAYENKAVTDALTESEALKTKANGYNGTYDKIKTEIASSQEAVRKITGGVDERLNWTLLMQYVNECLPRPDVSHLPADTIRGRHPQTSFRPKGLQAFQQAQARRAAGPQEGAKAEDARAEAKVDAAIKENLLLINIEGIDARYTDDFGPLFTPLKTDKTLVETKGMRQTEADLIWKGGEGLPKNGWLVEVRGYTDNFMTTPDGKRVIGAEHFILDTLVENLANPTKEAGIVLTKDMKEQIKDRIKFVMLYKYVRVEHPQTGSFELISGSSLSAALGSAGPAGAGAPGPGSMLGGKTSATGGKSMTPDGAGKGDGKGDAEAAKPSGPNRDAWRPLGEIASSVLSGGAAPSGRGGMGGSAMPPGYPGASKGKQTGAAALMQLRPNTSGVRPGTTQGAGDQEAANGTAPTRAPRTEFVIFFIWEERLPPEPNVESATPPVAS